MEFFKHNSTCRALILALIGATATMGMLNAGIFQDIYQAIYKYIWQRTSTHFLKGIFDNANKAVTRDKTSDQTAHPIFVYLAGPSVSQNDLQNLAQTYGQKAWLKPEQATQERLFDALHAYARDHDINISFGLTYSPDGKSPQKTAFQLAIQENKYNLINWFIEHGADYGGGKGEYLDAIIAEAQTKGQGKGVFHYLTLLPRSLLLSKAGIYMKLARYPPSDSDTNIRKLFDDIATRRGPSTTEAEYEQLIKLDNYFVKGWATQKLNDLKKASRMKNV